MLSVLLDITKCSTRVMAPSKEHIKLSLSLHLRGADHNCIQLIPSYCTALQKVKPVTKRFKVWTDESILSLQGCYECTDWEIFKESCSDIDARTDVVSCYVSFCADDVIPEKTLKVYPNSKPWVTKELRTFVYRKR